MTPVSYTHLDVYKRQEQITPKEYKERVLNNTITDVLQEYEIHPGDVFFLPAGRVHSIGAGAFIACLLYTSICV